MADLQARRTRSTVYGLAAVDNRGRIADGALFRALGWPPGTRLEVKAHLGLVLVRSDQQGVLSINRLGHLQLPVAVRRWCDLAPGDKVLLAAEPDQQLLVIHPPTTLDAMITQAHATLGGDTA
ncbi:AbrB/MazE/SpoVT family DNA-binding domain-containing protein [Dactylosporangium sp. NPDC005555]|uniref:AbrB/MazE/SpoVT family DNA-binding domain-containing protein n=1 Tax=Dactylosporangium sp. NPDC005555 TaxID=3154889 RepID=UPI0033BD436D